MSTTPLLRSFFAAKFVHVPAGSMYGLYIRPGVGLAEWPAEEMRDFLGRQRNWGDWILQDDLRCRQIVAVFLVAYDAAGLPEDAQDADLYAARVELLPFAGANRPVSLDAGESPDWIAPHLMNQLAGILAQHGGEVPPPKAKTLNALIDPMANRRLLMGLGAVVVVNATMWLIYGVDAAWMNARVNGGMDGGLGGSGDDESSMGADNATNGTLPGMPLVLHGVYPRQDRGVPGIFAMPFLHWSWLHMTADTIGLVALGAAVVVRHGPWTYALLSIFLWVWVGLLTWAAGDERLFYVGASGVIIGYLSHVVLLGVLKLVGCPPSRDCQFTWEGSADLVVGLAAGVVYMVLIYEVLDVDGSDPASVGAVDGAGPRLNAEDAELFEGVAVSRWEPPFLGTLGGLLFASGFAYTHRKQGAFSRAKPAKPRAAQAPIPEAGTAPDGPAGVTGRAEDGIATPWASAAPAAGQVPQEMHNLPAPSAAQSPPPVVPPPQPSTASAEPALPAWAQHAPRDGPPTPTAPPPPPPPIPADPLPEAFDPFAQPSQPPPPPPPGAAQSQPRQATAPPDWSVGATLDDPFAHARGPSNPFSTAEPGRALPSDGPPGPAGSSNQSAAVLTAGTATGPVAAPQTAFAPEGEAPPVSMLDDTLSHQEREA
eukprot:CAMPEP_0206055262 /NCGR_PEP_ID=MMETSP1466-20131121/39738_1 /ASSEMBLY_ACC=CAM_ASM_001126 /TAXON_ID=44452 /ORGANISM="Pavlova gyrans, Strain CCMP608" /LENGTH=652 /DNA_ID=CAMNT_0053430485 /DNA_START=123 /DNA_END=2077 /DNA_ORIENTATION=-